MRTVLLTLHVVLAIFLIGPLVSAANQGPRALTAGDAGGLRLLARVVTVNGWASIAVGVVGFGLVQRQYGDELTDPWLLVSILLFVLATLLVVLLLAPLLRAATAQAAGGGSTGHLAGRVGAVAGVSSLCYLVIAVLMVWQPGG
ncbi:MAG: DUF2269 family protein [Mycobacteriales bacterium]